MPTGVQWNTIPSSGASTAAQLAAQLELCRTASRWADSFCEMPLMATADVEEMTAPGPRAVADDNGVLWITPLRKPVLSVTSVETRPSVAFDSDYTAVTDTYITLLGNSGASELAAGAGTSRIRVVGSGIIKGFGWQSWSVRLTYVNGWANSELTASVAVGGTSISVLDATGFRVGDNVELPDAVNTETVTISAVSGTTLTVSALAHAHAAGVQVTNLPANIRTAAGWYAAHIALSRGSSAMSIPVATSGHRRVNPAGGETFYLTLAMGLLQPYKRVW